MTVDEIFSTIATHMLEGIMIHEQLMETYLFLGLKGYAACHEYHYLAESKERNFFLSNTIEHFGRLVETDIKRSQTRNLIPKSWYESTREMVDFQTRREAIAAGFDKWIDWEEETKELYSKSYKELLSLDEIQSAELIKGMCLDVEEELVYAKNERLAKASMSFDMVSIIEEQSAVEQTFKKKLKKELSVSYEF